MCFYFNPCMYIIYIFLYYVFIGTKVCAHELIFSLIFCLQYKNRSLWAWHKKTRGKWCYTAAL